MPELSETPSETPQEIPMEAASEAPEESVVGEPTSPEAKSVETGEMLEAAPKEDEQGQKEQV